MSGTPTLWRLPLWTAIAVILATAPLGYWGRDFGVFLLVFPIYLPTLLASGLGLLAWAIFEKRRHRRMPVVASAAVVLLGAPCIFFTIGRQHDRLAFLLWHPTHRQLVEGFSTRRGIIMDWDQYGFVGSSSESFLVSDPTDTLDRQAAAELMQCGEPDCPVAGVERMARGLYIVTLNY